MVGTKKKKRVLWVLGGVLVVVALLAAGYAYLAFMPTGFGSMRGDIAAANKRIDEKLAPQVKTTPPAGIGIEAPKTVIFLPNGKPGPGHRMNFYEEVASFDQYWSLWSAVMIDNRGFSMSDFSKAGVYIPPYSRYSKVIVTPPGYIHFVKRPQMGQALWANLDAPDSKEHLMCGLRLGFSHGEVTTSTTEQQNQLFNGHLDRLEGFLLRPKWDIPATSSPLNRYAVNLVFDRLTMLAIARASLRGDQARAMNLLDRYLDALRVLHMKSEDGDPAFKADGAAQVFFALAELLDFPAEGWRRARRILESMRLSQAELDDLRRIRVNAYHDRLLQELNNTGSAQNTWHFIFGGKLETVANRAMLPIAHRKAEQIALSVYKRDREALLAEQGEWQNIKRMMNVGPRHGFREEINPFLQELNAINNIDDLNGQIGRAILWLEAARARHDRAALPAVTVLGSQQLEPFTMPRFGRILIENRHLRGDFPAKLKPLVVAFNDFQVKHFVDHYAPLPTTPEEIETVLKAAGPGDWSEFVKWHDPVQVNLVWGTRSVMVGNAWFADAMKDKKRPDETIDLLELHAITIDEPILSEKIRAVLTNAKE